MSARGFARHFEGWQPALLSVILAGSAAILAVPRPAPPTFLPIPMVDPRALARAIETDNTRADAALSEGLDVDIRKLGSAIRAYGAAESEGDDSEILKARSLVVSTAVLALLQGEEGVLRLRAYQLRSFLAEVRRWEDTGDETPDLRELGGGFLRMLQRNGWSAGAQRKVLMDDGAQRSAWKRRWNEIAAIRRATFDPALDEQRSFYRFLLTHPLGRPGQRLSPAEEAVYEDQYRLKKIDELSAVDPAYPKDLARGIVLYRLGRYLLAAEALRRHLEAAPDGPFTLRARSYLRAALGRAHAEAAPEGAASP